MDDSTAAVIDIKRVFGDAYDDIEEDLLNIGYLEVSTVFDLDTLLAFALAVKTFYEEGYDNEKYDFETFDEILWNLAGEMVLAAKTEGWGGKTLSDLVDYFELNT